MYKKLSETANAEINKPLANLINEVLSKFKKIIENKPKDDNIAKRSYILLKGFLSLIIKFNHDKG